MLRRGLATAAFVFLSVFKTHAAERLSFVTEHLPPYQFEEDNRVKGFATDILKAALEHSDIAHSFTIYPWTRAYNMAKSNPNTCIYSIARTPQREKLFHWLQPITTTNLAFIGLASNQINIAALDDAKKYNIAVIRDDVAHQLLLHKGFEYKEDLYVVNNTYSLLKLLLKRDSIDLILEDLQTVKYRAKYDDLDPSLFKSYFNLNNTPLDFYVACSHSTSKSLIKRLDDGITKLKRSGDYQKIVDSQFERQL